MSLFTSKTRTGRVPFVSLVVALVGWHATLSFDVQAVESEQTKETAIYKTVGPTKIAADVYFTPGSAARPCVVWIHGGALIMGSREGVPGDIRKLCRERNYVLVSLDYRLAPEVQLPAIIDDIKDAFRWLRDTAPKCFPIDPTKVVVSGGSAGGYLTLMTGFAVEPRPRALVSYWGYGDIDAPWYTEPSEFYRQQPLVTKEDALAAVGGDVQTAGDGKTRGKYYLYLRQNGLWTKEIAGIDPTDRAKLTPFCPVRKVTPDYPPTILIHGTADTDVPYHESADMNVALEKHGVPHELITIEGGGHGTAGVDEKIVRDMSNRAMGFIRDHLE